MNVDGYGLRGRQLLGTGNDVRSLPETELGGFKQEGFCVRYLHLDGLSPPKRLPFLQ